MEVFLLTYPLAYLWFSSQMAITQYKPSKKLILVLVILMAVITFTPLSFYGYYLDLYFVFISLVTLFLYGLGLKKEGKPLGKYLVYIGKGSMYVFFIVILIPLFRFFALLGVNPIIYEPVEVHSIEEGYHLEHYRKNSNFSYPGTHTANIKKVIIPYVIEYYIGTAEIGRYTASNLPSHMGSYSSYIDDVWTTRPMPRIMYTIEGDSLIKSNYNHVSNSYVIEEKYKF